MGQDTNWQDEFTPGEWKTLQLAPFWISTAVAGADQFIDDAEGRALSEQLAHWKKVQDPLARELLGSIFADLKAVSTRFRAATHTEKAMAQLREVASLLDQKVSAEQARAVKQEFLKVGKATAEASGGGFLGLGDKVSPEERSMLSQIETVLGLSTL